MRGGVLAGVLFVLPGLFVLRALSVLYLKRSRASREEVMLKNVAAALLCIMPILVTSASAAPDWKAVAEALGKTGTEMPGDVYRVGLPRSDLTVILDG